MAGPNTKKIGDDFESKSLEIIQRLIEEKQIGVLSELVKIYHQKEYFSHQRQANIKFDLTIEVWPPGSTRYHLIYIIECKDYDSRVPIGKIEEFHNKILQVTGVNAKGIFITNSPLQKSALNYAKATGMMVIQAESRNQYEIILHKANHERSYSNLPVLIETIDKTLLVEGVLLLEKEIDLQINKTFVQTINDGDVSYGVDMLSKGEISAIAEKQLNKINPSILNSAHTLSLKTLKYYLTNTLRIELTQIDHNKSMLGYCNIAENQIGLSRSIIGTNRELFILAHEFGHFILHQKLSIGQSLYDLFEDSEYNFRTQKHDLKNPRQWIEWQANYFASVLILNQVPFIFRLNLTMDRLNMNRGKIYLDDQNQNRKNFNELIKKMAYSFEVTKTSIGYQLKELNLIDEHSRIKSIGQIMDEFRDDLFM